jgi:hypothetical protein
MIQYKNFFKYFYLTVLLLYLIVTTKNINHLIYKRPFKLNNLKPDFQLNYYNTNTWIINKNICQYSSHLFVKNGKLTQIDGLVITNYNLSVEYVKSSMRCLIKSIKTNQVIKLNISVVLKFLYNTLRVKCDIHGIDFENIAVAIIDEGEYTKESKEIINFQIANKINIPDVKLSKVAHCVHYSYHLVQRDIQKILSWLEIQKTIGISKIILYDSNTERIIEKEIYKVFKQEFVEVRPYFTDYEFICDSIRLNAYRLDNFENYEVLKEQCENAFYKIFRDPWSETMNRWKHQKISANDCYSTFEHVFEFVSYYDFDEIIYPRSYQTSNYFQEPESCLIKDFCKSFNHSQNLDLYKYIIDDIIPKHTNYSLNIATIYFENAFYFQNNYHLAKLMTDINDLMTKNRLLFTQDSSSHVRLHFKFTENIGHYFIIFPKDLEYIHKLYETYNQISCIYEKIDKEIDSRFDSNFKRFFFLITTSEHQLGKAIFKTDNVQAIHTHFTQYPLKARELVVKNTLGISTHFRNNYFKNALELNSSILNFKIDIEYFHYIVSKYSHICLKK